MDIKNFGISFGQTFPGMLAVIVLTWLLVLVMFVKTKSKPLLLVLLGSGLNIEQRIRLGYVVDYWKIPGTNLYNNFNDWLIFIGFGWYIWNIYKTKKLK